MPIGPQLPPSVEKRKRSDQEDSSESDDSVGPLPPRNDEEESKSKKPRVIGPALPSAIIPGDTEKEHEPPTEEGESSDDDDDFGPSLPPPPGSKIDTTPSSRDKARKEAIESAAPRKVQRDEWMTMAPTSGDWSQRIDPTKMKNRKFNTGRATTTISSGSDAWNETPEEKQARLKREVLGIKNKKGSTATTSAEQAHPDDIETARRIQEYNNQRGPSLYDAHQKDKIIEEDDPSARAFDREKDIGGGLQINATKRREMMKKSSDFNSRFSSARYL